MAIPLSDDERVVHDLHPHWAALVRPVLVFVVVCGAGTFGAFMAPHGDLRAPVRWAILAVAVVVLALWSLTPYLRWITTHYVLTTQRLVIRSGVVARSGRDVPLDRINDVSFSETLLERVLRSGTLVVESAGERGQITLANVPHVERVQRELYRLVGEHADRLDRLDRLDRGRGEERTAEAGHTEPR